VRRFEMKRNIASSHTKKEFYPPNWLIKSELKKRVNSFLPHTTQRRARLLKHLLYKGRDTGGSICNKCSIGNLSDAVIKLNRHLEAFGVHIVNYPPEVPIQNRFGEETQVHYWELVLIDG
jgi:hypothetical protein